MCMWFTIDLFGVALYAYYFGGCVAIASACWCLACWDGFRFSVGFGLLVIG